LISPVGAPIGRQQLKQEQGEQLGATLSWLGGRRLSVTKLILSELLPLARAGLRQASIAAEEIERYLGTVEERIERRRSASQWEIQSLDATG
jgi:hypothetical protein